MKIVVPHQIAASQILSSTIDEPDSSETAYSASSIYILGNQVVDATNHLTYESLIGTQSTVTISNGSPAVITWATHGLIENTPVVFTTDGALPTGLTAGTVYYVLDPQLNSFNVSTTIGGTAVNTSSAGSGTHTATGNPNLGYALTDTTAWFQVGSTNKFGMFDLEVSTASEADDAINVDVSISGTWAADNGTDVANTIALLGVRAQDVEIFALSAHPSLGSYSHVCKYSEEFDNAVWTKTDVTIDADFVGVIAPDGLYTSDRIIEDATTNQHSVEQTCSFTSGTSYTFSVYARIGTRSAIQLRLPSSVFGTQKTCEFNLSAGTAGTPSAGSTAGIEDAGNGWYRCYITATASASTSAAVGIYMVNGSTVYAGDGSSYVSLWGANVTGTSSLKFYDKKEGTVGSISLHQTDYYSEDLTARSDGTWRRYYRGLVDDGHSVFFALDAAAKMVGSSRFRVRVKTPPTGYSSVTCRAVVIGMAFDLGNNAELGAEAGELNFSQFTRNELTGRAILTPRRSVPTSELRVITDKANVTQLRQLRRDLSGTTALWVGVDDTTNDYFEAALTLGIYKRFSINTTHDNYAEINLSLEEF